jgi:hypothetical protein
MKNFEIRIEKILKYAVFLLAIFLLNGLVYFYYQNNLHLTDGNYIYPLDDTYIHLAIAKNWAFFHNWGVVHDEFCSTSSSPVYTALLSLCIKIGGNSTVYPLYINLFFGNLIIIVSFIFFRKNIIVFFFYCFFLFTPVLLHIQILSGMEHTLHIFIMITAIMLFFKIIRYNFEKTIYWYLFLIVIGFSCLVRYESVFFVLPVVFIFCLYKQYKHALITFIIAFLPVVLFGIYSISKGGYFVPNSLLVKGGSGIINTGGVYFILKNLLEKFYRFYVPAFCIPIMAILIVLIFDFIDNYHSCEDSLFHNLNSIIKKYAHFFVVSAAIFVHSLFAGFGWLYRYEAYLYALLYFSLCMAFRELITGLKTSYCFTPIKTKAFLLISLVCLLPALGVRLISSHSTIKQAGKNIYDQQIQMSRFLHGFYNNANVAANDIGAITYYTGIKLLDLVGLGSNAVLAEKLRGGGV